MTAIAKLQSLLRLPFVQQVLQTYSTRVIAMGLGLVCTVVATRTLGPEGRGWLASTYATAALALVLGSMGFNISVSYFAAKMPDKRPELLGNSLAASAAITPLIGLALGIVSLITPSLVQLPGLFFPLTLIYIGIQLVMQSIQQLLIAMGEVAQCNWQELTLRLIALVLTALIAYLGLTKPLAYFSASIIACAVATVWCTLLAYRRLHKRIHFSLPLARECAGYSFKNYLTALIGCVIMQLDVVLIQIFHGPAEAGCYGAACSVRSLLLFLPTVVSSLLLPRLLSNYRSAHAAIAPTVRVTLVSCLVMALACLATALVATPLMCLIFGNEFAPAGQILVWLMPGTFIYTVSAILSCIVYAAGLPWNTFRFFLPLLAADILLNYLWIPRWHSLGAAAAFSTICLVQALVFAGLAAYYYRTLPRNDSPSS